MSALEDLVMKASDLVDIVSCRIEDIALELIRPDHRAQPRDSLSTEITNTYADEMRGGASFPPLIVFDDGQIHWLADGFHRHAAAQAVGLKSLSCEVRQGSLREAILFSCGANAAHGHRRSNEDKRRAVRRLLEDAEWRGWSDREIARRCSVSHQMVGELRATMEPAVMADTGRATSMTDADNGHDGSQRTFVHHKTGQPTTMDTAAIGKSNGSVPIRGTRIEVPDGESVSDMIRRGLVLESSGANADGVAKQLGVDVRTYRQSRDIVLLAARDDLNASDSALARAAAAELDDARQSRAAHDKIARIAKRIWGGQGGRRSDAREAQRFEAFEGAITIIVDACDRGSEITLPHLSRAQADEINKQIKRAEAALRTLRSKIEEAQR